MTSEEELVRAGQAREILEHHLFREAVKDIETALLAGIHRSAFSDEKLREKLAQRYALLQDLLGQFRTHMETGKLAEETIRRKTMAERIKAAVVNF